MTSVRWVVHGPILHISHELRDRFTIILFAICSVQVLSSIADAVIVLCIMHLWTVKWHLLSVLKIRLLRFGQPALWL